MPVEPASAAGAPEASGSSSRGSPASRTGVAFATAATSGDVGPAGAAWLALPPPQPASATMIHQWPKRGRLHVFVIVASTMACESGRRLRALLLVHHPFELVRRGATLVGRGLPRLGGHLRIGERLPAHRGGLQRL